MKENLKAAIENVRKKIDCHFMITLTPSSSDSPQNFSSGSSSQSSSQSPSESLSQSSSDKIRSFRIPLWLPCVSVCIVLITIAGLCLSTYTTRKVLDELQETSLTLEKSIKLNGDLKERMQQLDSQLIEAKNEAAYNEEKFNQLTLEQRTEYMEKIQYYNERAEEIEQELKDLRDLKKDLENSITKTKASSSATGAGRIMATLNSVLDETGMGGPDESEPEPMLSEGTEAPEATDLNAQSTKKSTSERSLYVTYNFLDTRVKKEIEEYSYLLNNINDLKTLMSIQPGEWPARGVVTSEAGERRDPFTGSTTSHSGMDIAVPIGTPVRVTFDGTVAFADESGGYGLLVIVNHADGMQTYYAHNSELLVVPGERLEKGQVLAKSGNTGRSTGPHVHYEVRINGEIKNPRDYMKIE